MARALLIFNPAAARAHPRILNRVRKVLTGAGWHVEVTGTTHPGHAAELARAGVDDGADVIAVYGGDGTTMQAVRGLVGRDVPVGLIPGGTGNLLAGNLRLPRNPIEAARIVTCGIPRRIDLGILRRPGADRFFAVACGTGFDAEMMAATSGEAKRRWRMGAYVVQGWEALNTLKVATHRVTVDGRSFETDAIMVLVANCGELIPPFFRLRDGIAPDDGVFDIVVVNASTIIDGLDIVCRILLGRVENDRRIQFARGQVVTVETDRPQPVELDGEPGGETPFTAEILPQAIDVIVPRP